MADNPPAETVEPNGQEIAQENQPAADDTACYYQADAYYDWKPLEPLQVTGAWSCFDKTKAKPNNFTKGCKWAPDGACLLSNSEDSIMRIFALPPSLWSLRLDWQEMTEMQPLVKVKERDIVNDFAWYPRMTSQDPVTCCFAVCCKSTPIHLWNAFNGELQATYLAINHVEELKGAQSLAFDPMGGQLYTGFNKMVRIFDLSRPGRQVENRQTHTKSDGGQTGIISCFAFDPAGHSMYAAGSYNRTIGLYSMKSGYYICEMEGHSGGVTHLEFSPCGTKLYSGARKDNEILCWDVRNPGIVLARMRRVVATHQRMFFALSSSGRWLVSGNHNGVVTVWDTEDQPQLDSDVLLPTRFFQAHSDCVSGVSLHPSLPLMATGSGQRHFPQLVEDEDDPVLFKPPPAADCSLRLWWLQAVGAQDLPSTDKPILELPSTDQPISNLPSTDQPILGLPSTDQPISGLPSTDQPPSDLPSTDQPISNLPSTDQPILGLPSTDQPPSGLPSTDQPISGMPSTDHPTSGLPPSIDDHHSPVSKRPKVS